MVTKEQVLKAYDQQANFYKLLTHPVRLAILNVLRDEEACVCHLEAVLGFPQAYISQQLAVLRGAGLVHDRRENWNIFYHVSDRRIYDMIDFTEGMLHPEGPSILLQRLPDHCTCPKCSRKNGEMPPPL